MHIKFPVAADHFPPLVASSETKEKYKALVTAIVKDTRREYDEFAREQQGKVDLEKWQLVKTKGGLQLFSRKTDSNGNGDRSSNLSNSSQDGSNRSATSRRNGARGLKPTCLCVGTMEGTLDDLVYGLQKPTREDMKLMASFVGDERLLDCAVLHTLKQSSSTFLGLKWQLMHSTTGQDRDMCFLEYVGVYLDSRGKRFGLHVRESVPVSVCPAFPDPSIVRTNMSFAYLFRDSDKVPGSVEVFLQGAFAPALDIGLSGGSNDLENLKSVLEEFLSLGQVMEYSDTKQLTAFLASQAARESVPQADPFAKLECALCKSKPKFLAPHSLCQGCTRIVCKKCRVKRNVLPTASARRIAGSSSNSSSTREKVTCCTACVEQVKRQSPFASQRKNSSDSNSSGGGSSTKHESSSSRSGGGSGRSNYSKTASSSSSSIPVMVDDSDDDLMAEPVVSKPLSTNKYVNSRARTSSLAETDCSTSVSSSYSDDDFGGSRSYTSFGSSSYASASSSLDHNSMMSSKMTAVVEMENGSPHHMIKLSSSKTPPLLPRSVSHDPQAVASSASSSSVYATRTGEALRNRFESDPSSESSKRSRLESDPSADMIMLSSPPEETSELMVVEIERLPSKMPTTTTTHQLQPTRIASTPAAGPAELYNQMMELRVAAERAYHTAHQNSQYISHP